MPDPTPIPDRDAYAVGDPITHGDSDRHSHSTSAGSVKHTHGDTTKPHTHAVSITYTYLDSDLDSKPVHDYLVPHDYPPF